MSSAVIEKAAGKKVKDMDIYPDLAKFAERMDRLSGNINCAASIVEDVARLVGDAYREGWTNGSRFVLDSVDEINKRNENAKS